MPAVHVAFAKVVGWQAGVHGLCRRNWRCFGGQDLPPPVWWLLHCSEVALEPKVTGWFEPELQLEGPEVAGFHGLPGSCLWCQSDVGVTCSPCVSSGWPV